MQKRYRLSKLLIVVAAVYFLCLQNASIPVRAETATGSAISMPESAGEQSEIATSGALTIATPTPTPTESPEPETSEPVESSGYAVAMLVEETTTDGITWWIDDAGVLTLTGTGTLATVESITTSTAAAYFPWLEHYASITHVVADCSMPPNSAYFFYRIAAETIEFGGNFDTSHMVRSDGMFSATHFKTLDLSGWNTEQLVSFKDMFRGSYTQYLNMSGWDFSGGSTFGNWAYGNNSFIEINCSGCDFTGLTELPGWNGCTDSETCTIKKIDYSNIIAPDATRFSSEIQYSPAISPQNFGSYHSLESITLENAVLTSMTDLTRWFASCYKLTEVNLTGAQFGDITSMEEAFLLCNSFTDLSGIIGLKELPLSKNTSMVSMFERCGLLETVDLTGVDTSSVEDLEEMFRECTSLKNVMVSDGAFPSVTSLTNMFMKCTALEQVDFLPRCSFANVKWADQMFTGCTALAGTVVFPDMPKVTTFSYAFRSCSKLDSVDLTAVTSPKFSVSRFLNGCSSITRIGLPDTGVVFTDVTEMTPSSSWSDYDDDTMTKIAFDETSTFSGWYARVYWAHLGVSYFDKDGNAVSLTGNAEATFPPESTDTRTYLYDEELLRIYQQVYSTNPALNRDIPFSLDLMEKPESSDGYFGVYNWEVLTRNGITYTALDEYTAVPFDVMKGFKKDTDYKKYNNADDPVLSLINRAPVDAAYPAVAYLARVVVEEPLEPSYTVVLPAVIELTPDADGKKLSGAVPVGISYVLPETGGSITVRIDSTSLSMINQDSDLLDVNTDKAEIVWEAETMGVTKDEEGVYTGAGTFYLTTPVKAGQWTGSLVVQIIPDFTE